MHASPVVPVLHWWLRRACPAIHAGRATAVVTVVEALVLGAKLALTHLGRNLRSTAFAKHSIKRVDRLLGNRHLHAPARGAVADLSRRRPPAARGDPAAGAAHSGSGRAR